MTKVMIGQKREGLVPGWWCEAHVADQMYQVGILVIATEGSRPDVWGVVRDDAGKVMWQERVSAAVSPRDLLRQSGILPG